MRQTGIPAGESYSSDFHSIPLLHLIGLAGKKIGDPRALGRAPGEARPRGVLHAEERSTERSSDSPRSAAGRRTHEQEQGQQNLPGVLLTDDPV